MEQKDILKKYLAHNEQVRVFVIDATDMVSSFRDLHQASNVVTAAVGRTLMATTMISAMLKSDTDRVTTQIKANGPIGNIVVCGGNKLEMKAYATNPKIDIAKKSNGKLDVSGIICGGKLTVIKDIGLKEPYVGVCDLVSSEIAEDFAYYFVTSEQTPCAVFLGVNFSKENIVKKACGYIIEPLPDASDEVISKLENINRNIDSVTNLMLDINNIDEVAKFITGDENIKCIEEKVPLLKCDCNKQRIEKTIIALGKKEALKIYDENNKFEVYCHFCNKKYLFSREEIERLFT